MVYYLCPEFVHLQQILSHTVLYCTHIIIDCIADLAVVLSQGARAFGGRLSYNIENLNNRYHSTKV